MADVTTNNKRIINQQQLDELIAEHREKLIADNYEMLDLSNCKFENIEFTGDYSLIDFSRSEFDNCKFNNAHIEDSEFYTAKILDSDISSSVFKNCFLDKTELAHDKINETNFIGSSFYQAIHRENQLNFTTFYKCNLLESNFIETSFSHNIVQNSYNTNLIYKSTSVNEYEANEAYKQKFDETFYGNVHYDFDIEKTNLDRNYKVNIHTYIENELVKSEDVMVDYDLKSNMINVFDNDITSKAALQMLESDIKNEIQKTEYEASFDNSPRVLINSLDNSLTFHEGQSYDLKEFASRLAVNYNRNTNIEYTLYFKIGDNKSDNLELQQFQGEINLYPGDTIDLVEHLESYFFSPKAMAYFKEYIQAEDTSQERKINQYTERKEAPAYHAFAYINGKEEQRPVHVTGNTPEEIINKLQEWNLRRGKPFAVCYMRQTNADTKDFTKYDVKTGADITPIYLNLPSIGSKNLTKLVSDLRSKGAKYNPIQKALYVTKQDDLGLFAAYLPDAYKTFQEPRTAPKSSVIEKLNSNKSKVNSESYTQQKQQHRNNEVPMI